METNKDLTAYAAAFVDELERLNVCDVVVSPGSRSTPLAMLMAEKKNIKVWMQMDERSAGFFALGISKAKNQPAALVCTSGTAAANYLPAVIEAFYSRIPLLILTSDRPHELRDVGAPQAVDQINLYGKYAKLFIEMALPEDKKNMLNYVRTMAGRAVSMASSGSAGAVHLNFPFREPLIPDLTKPDLWDGGCSEGKSYIQVKNGKRQLEKDEIQNLAEELKEMKKGLIVCGPENKPNLAEETVKLAAVLQYPILADPLSQLRCGSHLKEWIVDSYDAFLRNERVKNDLKPEVIIRFGAMPVSKAYLLYLKAHPETRQIIIDSDGGWREPTLLASDMLYTDPIQFCKIISDCIEKRPCISEWGERWIELNELSRNYMQTHGQMDGLFEGQAVIELQEVLPDNTTLFVGNSMPIRDLDSFFAVNDKNIKTMANRGANGIDGVVSTAVGAGLVNSPSVLLIGDLSFYHDLNGLLFTKLKRMNITIIVLNNDGGGIFSFLPQAEHEKHFEKLFGTPMGLDFEYAVRMYGGSFTRIINWNEFRERLSVCILEEGLSVIEIPTNRRENAQNHRMLWNNLNELIDKWFEDEN